MSTKPRWAYRRNSARAESTKSSIEKLAASASDANCSGSSSTAGLTFAPDQHPDRAALDEKHEQRAANHDDGDRQHEGNQH